VQELPVWQTNAVSVNDRRMTQLRAYFQIADPG
jgi:hypothetical protein